MKVTVIGGTGHIGSFLIPRLVEAGHTVACISRQKSKPYFHHQAWQSVEHVTIDRLESEEKGDFGAQVA